MTGGESAAFLSKQFIDNHFERVYVMSNIGELAEKFEQLVKNKTRAAKEEADCKQEISRIEQELLDAMSDEGLQNLTLASGMTLFKRCDRFYGVAEGRSKAELVKALANCPMTMDLVEANYNSNSLRSRIKEIEANGDVLPEEVSALLKVTEQYKVGHRG